MQHLKLIMSAMRFGLLIGLALLAGADSCLPQTVPPVRGKYTPGFNATNSGVMPEPGFSYLNTFMDYSFDQAKGSNGQLVALASSFLAVGFPRRTKNPTMN